MILTTVRNLFLLLQIFFVFQIFSVFPVQANEIDNSEQVKKFVNDTATKVLSIISSNANDEEKRKELNIMFLESVEVDWMGKFALGKYYRKITDTQLKEYLSVYKKFLLDKYVSKFAEYNGQNLNIEGVYFKKNKQYIVDTTIENKKSKQSRISIVYRIKDHESKFLIRDIIAEGLSLILGQRSEFNHIIMENGIDSLIQMLSKKINKT